LFSCLERLIGGCCDLKKARKKKVGFDYKLFVFISLVVVFIIALLFFGLKVYSSFQVVEFKSINFTLNVTDHVGIILDSDKLHFGGVIPGGYSSRSLFLLSEIEGFVFIKSDYSDLVKVNNQGLFVDSDGARFDFRAVVPKNMDYQDVEGEIHFYVMKSDKRWLLRFFSGGLLDVFVEQTKKPTISLDIVNN